MGLFDRFRSEGGQEPAQLAQAEAPVTETMIWLCEKCGAKLGSTEDNPSRTIQKTLKSMIKEQGAKRQKRAMITSCLNICPKGQIACAVVKLGGATQFYEFSLTREPEALATEILKMT